MVVVTGASRIFYQFHKRKRKYSTIEFLYESHIHAFSFDKKKYIYREKKEKCNQSTLHNPSD